MEKLRWAEKEWRELDTQMREAAERDDLQVEESLDSEDEIEAELV